MTKIDATKVDQHFEKIKKHDKVKEALIYVEDYKGELAYFKAHKRDIDTPMLLASVTKLYTTACIFILMEQGKLSLDDKVIDHLPEESIANIHTYKGIDYTKTLTIRHLLFQTSGLPDYFLGGGMNSLFLKVLRNDFPYTFEDSVSRARNIKTKFAPGSSKKAYYADINFDLLGRIIEVVTGSTLKEVYHQFIIEPLDLTNTYLPDRADFIPHTYLKGMRIQRPMYIRSCHASGGGVSTAKELMIFLKAFWKGELFSPKVFDRLTDKRSMQASYHPIKYSAGYMDVIASKIFGKKVPLVGHSGSMGAFAFYSPEQDLFYVGDIPQMDAPNLAVRFVMKTALAGE